MGKWFLVSYANRHGGFIVNDEFSDTKMFSQGGQCTSRSISYNSKEELMIGCKIHNKMCTKCGEYISLRTLIADELKEMQVCSSCHFWIKTKKSLNNKKRVIIKGVSYWVENPTSAPNHCKGHSGHEFKIKRFDSKEIITTDNLWHNGEVPELFKKEILDNAEFIK